MKATKRILSALIASAMLLSLTACGGSKAPAAASSAAPSASGKAPVETVTLKLATEMATGTPEVKATEMFAQNVFDKTGGEVKIEIYADGQLGEPATAIESTQLGNIDIVILPASDFKSYDSIFGIEAIPFLYADNDSVSKVLNDSGAAETQKKILADNGLIQLNEARNYFRGPYRVLASREPIREISDLQGLRFRAFDNKNYITAYETLGANPLVIPYSEVYMALQNGTVDAATCTISALKGENYTEICKYVTYINEYVSTVFVLAGEKTYNKLSEENQKILKECADQLGRDVSALTDESLQANIDAMKADGVEFIEIDTTPAREALKDFYYALEADGTLPAGTCDTVLAQ
ncbi:TRAP transporter substrate-binding protein [Dysosmobacter sp.]|uniref:TRAP transporter substrate-binding protein n=1 Tax=Dysosmobacter sp. TaxID=2591382 RepID=UPI002A8C12B4|nr:TRAP transporter substrate-binding protein [Dysosmobacter sp.]MDY3282359.1 TRAP transporter substrate-binding protein [Dysosmobacter sp.]